MKTVPSSLRRGKTSFRSAPEGLSAFIRRVKDSSHAYAGWWVCTTNRSAAWVGGRGWQWYRTIPRLRRLLGELSTKGVLHLITTSLTRPPIFFRNAGGYPSEPSVATDAIKTRDEGLVLLDWSTGVAVHEMLRPYPENYLKKRMTLQIHLPSPDFELHPGGTLMIEELVEGPSFGTASEPERERLARDIINHLKPVARDTAGPASSLWLEEALTHFDAASGLPDGLRALVKVKQTALERLATQTPTSLNHGDLWEKNIIRGHSGWPIIDFDDTARFPFFFDAYHFLGLDLHLRSLLLKGSFDLELTSLAECAGAVSDPKDHALKLLAAGLITLYRVPAGDIPNLLRPWVDPGWMLRASQ